MQYPLPETIGNPDLFVGREEEFEYLNEWLERIPNRLSIQQLYWHVEKVVKQPF